jgi:hypothetical protein
VNIDRRIIDRTKRIAAGRRLNSVQKVTVAKVLRRAAVPDQRASEIADGHFVVSAIVL